MGVASFHWQRNSPPPTPHNANAALPRAKEDDRERTFHNPALAAIRASQQLQELSASGDLSGLDESVQSSINGLREMAAEQDRKFREQQQSLYGGDGGRDDTNWNGMMGNGASTTGSHTESVNGSGSLKRRISELSDTDTQPTRPPPPLVSPLYHYEQTPQILDVPYRQRQPQSNGHAGGLQNSYDGQKRRPDPNDDTIGSDLDDSDDEGEIDSENEDEDMPLMLCSYDKVHRTKNKWRANLANGVVCINGREWLFEKGNGEYEW